MQNLIKCNISQGATLEIFSNINKTDESARPSLWTFSIGRGLSSKPIEVRITDADMTIIISAINIMSPYSVINIEVSKNNLYIYRGQSEIILNKKMDNDVIDQNTIHLSVPIRCILAHYYLDLSTYTMTNE